MNMRLYDPKTWKPTLNKNEKTTTFEWLTLGCFINLPTKRRFYIPSVIDYILKEFITIIKIKQNYPV